MNFAGDIAVIHLGINDTDPRDWPNYRDDFVRDYLSLIDSCRKANPNTQFISSAAEITERLPEGVLRVGVCGATSTPKWLMEEIAERVRILNLPASL